MKVLLVADTFKEENNGVTMKLYRYLISMGDEVRVLFRNHNEKGKEHYYMIPTLNPGPIIDSEIKKAAVELAKSVKTAICEALKDIDIVHIMMPSALGNQTAKIAHEKGIPITAGFPAQIEKFTKRYSKTVYKNLYRYVDAIQYPTKDIRSTFQKHIKRKTNGYVISGGVDNNDVFLIRHMLLDYCGREASMTGKYFYYRDRLHDDFANTNIKTQLLDDNFKIIRTGALFKAVSFFLYYCFAKPLAWILNKCYYHQKIVNRKALKECRDKGYFIYANHTAAMGDAFTPNLLSAKRNYIISSHDAFSLKGLKNIVLMLGAIPVFKSGEGYKNYVQSMEYRIKQKRTVTIYSEAHIWPYFTDIRPFSGGSFRYSYDMDAPVYCLTNTWVKRRIGRKPRLITYVDGPFYPDKSLERTVGIEKLKNEVYSTMKSRSTSVKQYQYIKYIEVPNHND